MYLAAPCNRYYTPQVTISEGRAEVVLPVREDLFHALGGVHGSAYFKALDDAAFFAANSLVEEFFVLTTSFNIYLTRPVSSGEMTARGEVVNRSRSQVLAQAVVSDSEGREIGRGSGTFAISNKKLTPEVGYR